MIRELGEDAFPKVLVGGPKIAEVAAPVQEDGPGTDPLSQASSITRRGDRHVQDAATERGERRELTEQDCVVAHVPVLRDVEEHD